MPCRRQLKFRMALDGTTSTSEIPSRKHRRFTRTSSNPVRVGPKYFVYLLRSRKDGHWYTGYTEDLQKRLRQYAQGESMYTNSRGPYDLIYYEACIDKIDAQVREIYLKTGMGKRYLKNPLKRFLTLTG